MRHLVSTHEQYDAAVRHLQLDGRPITVDVETNGLWWRRDHVVSVQIGTQAGDVYYFPFRHGAGPNLPAKLLRQLATEVLRPDRLQIYHHGAFDMKMLVREGYTLPTVWRDTLLEAHLLNELEPSYKLETLSAKYLQRQGTEERDLLRVLAEAYPNAPTKGLKGLVWTLPADHPAMLAYGCADIELTTALAQHHEPHLKAWGLEDHARGIAHWQTILAKMEMRGVRMDLERLRQVEIEARAERDRLGAWLEEAAFRDTGQRINLASVPQLMGWLRDAAGLTLPDTQAMTLKQFAHDERVANLLRWRVESKTLGTFVATFEQQAADNGRIYTNYSLSSPEGHGTVSSRLSSHAVDGHGINSQQVPKRMRSALVADSPEHRFVQLDLSQAELRLAAHYYLGAGDSSLAAALSGTDMHQRMADRTGLVRKKAKAPNFALQYGAGPPRLASMLGWPIDEAREYYSDFHDEFPGLRRVGGRLRGLLRQQGYFRLWNGRRAWTDKPHTAFNRLIQGGVAEWLREAAVRIDHELSDVPWALTVHDSLVFMAHKDDALELAREAKRILEDTPWCRVPARADAEWGYSWGEMETL